MEENKDLNEKQPPTKLHAGLSEEEVERVLDSLPTGETEAWEDDQTVDADKVARLLRERKFSELRQLLEEHRPTDIAELLDASRSAELPILFRLLPKDLAAEVFVEMDGDGQEALLSGFNDRELQAVLGEMAMDDTVDLIEEMPANVVRRILRNCSGKDRAQINRLLQYPKDSAGSMMTTEYVSFKKTVTVADAFAILRRVAIDKETIYTCYVIDGDRKLIGLVTVKDLLLAPLNALLCDIMEENVISADTHTDREDVAQVLKRYNFLALPVVDREDRLVGIVTYDDAMEVIQEETEEDFAKMAAMAPTETPYLKTSAYTLWKTRIPWLMILMLSATFTGMIISGFESALAGCLALSAFIPMLMGTGGNSGSQASVAVIRGLSLGEITLKDAGRVLWKELRVSLLCGVALALATFGKVLLVDRLLLGNPEVTVAVALTVSLTLCVTVVCAKIIGCLLPLLAERIGFDPAVMASPFITTIVDAVSLLLYFAIAYAVIPGMLV